MPVPVRVLQAVPQSLSSDSRKEGTPIVNAMFQTLRLESDATNNNAHDAHKTHSGQVSGYVSASILLIYCRVHNEMDGISVNRFHALSYKVMTVTKVNEAIIVLRYYSWGLPVFSGDARSLASDTGNHLTDQGEPRLFSIVA